MISMDINYIQLEQPLKVIQFQVIMNWTDEERSDP